MQDRLNVLVIIQKNHPWLRVVYKWGVSLLRLIVIRLGGLDRCLVLRY